MNEQIWPEGIFVCTGQQRTRGRGHLLSLLLLLLRVSPTDIRAVNVDLKLGTTRYYERLEIEQLLAENDIVCLQDTWLSKQQEEQLICTVA